MPPSAPPPRDYRGEPTPYAWPDVNSHFGIIDLAGFPKDRFYWCAMHHLSLRGLPRYMFTLTPPPPRCRYKAWFTQPAVPIVWTLPHWNWMSGDSYPIWVYSNADAVELFVNGVSQGKKAMPQYGHVEWDGVPFAPGSLHAVAYTNASSSPAAEQWVNTTGPAAALRISIKDGFGAGALVAGCADAAIVDVAIVDASGLVHPLADNAVTFSVSGDATLAGTSNGDPACLVNNKSPTRPAFHGLLMAVILGGTTPSDIVVTASADGFAPVSITIPQALPPAGWSTKWCHADASW